MNAISRRRGGDASVPVISRPGPVRPGLRGKRQGWPFPAQQGQKFAPLRQPGQALGEAMDIGQVAKMLGCSPWTVRQRLIPMGLPHLRFSASGMLHFYAEQVMRWVEHQQQGGT